MKITPYCKLHKTELEGDVHLTPMGSGWEHSYHFHCPGFKLDPRHRECYTFWGFVTRNTRAEIDRKFQLLELESQIQQSKNCGMQMKGKLFFYLGFYYLVLDYNSICHRYNVLVINKFSKKSVITYYTKQQLSKFQDCG